jgi:hypothetical protein
MNTHGNKAFPANGEPRNEAPTLLYHVRWLDDTGNFSAMCGGAFTSVQLLDPFHAVRFSVPMCLACLQLLSEARKYVAGRVAHVLPDPLATTNTGT